MSKMKNGVVCYFDLLGFSYLTTNINDKKNIKILKNNFIKFHEIINNEIQKSKINVTILSDCVFLYTFESIKIDALLYNISNIMRNCIKNGILVRGGICYGKFEVVATSLSPVNLFGEAVTNAVHFEEKKGKGCRIFTDENLHKESDLCCYTNVDLIHPYRNFQNFETLDVFEWPYIVNSFCISNSNPPILHSIPDKILDLILDNFILYSHLLYSEDFKWNCINESSLLQLGSTIEYLTNIQQNIFNMIGLSFSAYQNIDGLRDLKNRNNDYRDRFIKGYTDFVDYLRTTDTMEILKIQDHLKKVGENTAEFLNEKLLDFMGIK